jgi:putative transcription factor
MYSGYSDKQWETVVIRKKKSVSDAPKETQVKTTQPKSKGLVNTDINMRKLENDTENTAHERVSPELKKQIIQARIAKKLTQSELAQKINERPQVVQEYESGKAIPENKVLQKMSRVLGVTLKK